MIGLFAVSKKAAKFGYKRYGLPGAIVAGTAGAIGTVIIMKKLKAIVTPSDEEKSN